MTTTYVVCLYDLRQGYWQVVRVAETHTGKQAAREAVRRLEAEFPSGGITQGYGIATVEM